MVELERSLGLWEVTLMSVGIILGAGIYVIIGEAAGLTGNSVWLSFVIGAVVATLTGLSYAELSSRFPKAGAEYVYISESFGRWPAWIVGWLIIAGNIIGAAAVAIGFSNYASALFDTPTLPIAVLVLILCGVILITGVKETATITILFTLIEAAGLVIIILIGLQRVGEVDYLELTNGVEGLIEAGVIGFFSYIGFQGISRLSEETRDPESNIPKAILLSIIITTAIYILVGIAAVSVIPGVELGEKDAPLARIAEVEFGEESFVIISGIALFSTFNTSLMMLLAGSRLVYGISKEEALPRMFSRVSRRTLAPVAAILGVVVLALAFALLGDLRSIANLTNFSLFVVFIVVNASVIYFRVRAPRKGGFRVPLAIGRVPVLPILGILASMFMIVSLRMEILLLGGVLLIVGVVFYEIYNRFGIGK